jgi:hypothetical protein
MMGKGKELEFPEVRGGGKQRSPGVPPTSTNPNETFLSIQHQQTV